MSNYENSIIYKICCKNTDITDFYIGTTINFKSRKTVHKFKTNKCHSLLYSTIRNNGGWENWTMIEIEKVKCNDKRELEKKEREYIEKLKPTLNQYIPTRSFNEYQKVIYKCECGSIIKRRNKADHNKSIKHNEYINSKLTNDLLNIDKQKIQNEYNELKNKLEEMKLKYNFLI